MGIDLFTPPGHEFKGGDITHAEWGDFYFKMIGKGVDFGLQSIPDSEFVKKVGA
mgnify:FL=1|jgi:hypothetical protein